MIDHLSHDEKLVELNDVELCLETFGNPANPTILFVDGATASMLWWATLVDHYAMNFDGSSRDFASITAPALVVHDDHDPPFPLPHGHALRDTVPGAMLLIPEGAGHDLPQPLWDVFVPASLQHTEGGRP
jgi:hypothetical protein